MNKINKKLNKIYENNKGTYNNKFIGGCPSNTSGHNHMKLRNKQNKKLTKAELWAKNQLDQKAKVKFNTQVIWGYRIFDFWSHELGIAVEIDGSEHDKVYDKKRDNYNYLRSGIVVLRVRNYNTDDLNKAIETINNSDLWLERRAKLDILTEAQQRRYLALKEDQNG